MASLLLKNVPDALRDQLKARAESHRRSMNQEALHILEQAMPAATPLDVKAVLAFKPVKLNSAVDLAKLLREARDERGESLARAWVSAEAPVAADGPSRSTAKAKRRKR